MHFNQLCLSFYAFNFWLSCSECLNRNSVKGDIFVDLSKIVLNVKKRSNNFCHLKVLVKNSQDLTQRTFKNNCKSLNENV